MRKVASAGNRLNPSSNGISALLESCMRSRSELSQYFIPAKLTPFDNRDDN